jgi:hypothetical protein
MLANICSGSLDPSLVKVAARRDEESTLTSAVNATPGAFAETARSIAAQSATAPPDSAGSLPPSTTRQCGDWLVVELIAQALPREDADIISTIDAEMTRRIQ